MQHRKSAALTSFKALYPFSARNGEELSFEADDIVEVRRSLLLLLALCSDPPSLIKWKGYVRTTGLRSDMAQRNYFNSQ